MFTILGVKHGSFRIAGLQIRRRQRHSGSLIGGPEWITLVRSHMRTHQQIDARSLAMARAIVARIDVDPARSGLEKARSVCRRWHKNAPSATTEEWLAILERPWEEIRAILLNDSEEGCRLRQSDPFCGILSTRERWAIYREFDEAQQP